MAKRVYATSYRLTARRRAALRKAQLASARKRKNRRKAAKVAVGAGVIAATMAGSYQRSRKRSIAAQNVVQKTTLAGFRTNQQMHTISVVTGQVGNPGRGGELDLLRFDIASQLLDEKSKIDFGKLGQPRRKYTSLTFRRGVAQNKLRKAARGTRGRRVIDVFPDGSTGPIGAKARYNVSRRMSYKPSVRRSAYQGARDRYDPPPWLGGLVQRRSERNAKIVRETKAAKQRARRAKKK